MAGNNPRHGFNLTSEEVQVVSLQRRLSPDEMSGVVSGLRRHLEAANVGVAHLPGERRSRANGHKFPPTCTPA